MTDPSIRRALDACRPGSDDLEADEMQAARERLANDPQLAEAFARSQALDARISHAFRDLPVPEGLADRLVQRLQAAPPAPGAEAAGQRPEAAASRSAANLSGPIAAGRPRRRRGLRWAAAVAAGLAAVVLGAVVVRQFSSGDREPRPDEAFRGLVQEWSVKAAAGPWREDFPRQLLESYPLDAAVRVLPSGWRRFPTPYDPQAVVYNLSTPREASALLFCFRSEADASELDSMPPRVPFSTTGGMAVGMWRRGDRVYVLAVRGGVPRYQEFVEPSSRIGFRLSLPEKLS